MKINININQCNIAKHGQFSDVSKRNGCTDAPQQKPSAGFCRFLVWSNANAKMCLRPGMDSTIPLPGHSHTRPGWPAAKLPLVAGTSVK